MKKDSYISALKEGERVDDLFLVKSAKLAETKTGKPYLVLTVMDRSGEISGPVWENAEFIHAICVPGEVVHVIGTPQAYREKLQLKIEVIEKIAQEGIDLSLFCPTSTRNLLEMVGELEKIIQTVSEPYLRKLLNYFFKNHDWLLRFQDAPAAKAIHHAYIGGLLEHSLSVARIADFLANHYTGIDRSLLLAGALLHDIGKVEELMLVGGVIDYTVRGRLKGHLVIGSEMIAFAASCIRDFPKELLEQVQHLVLSHHGKHEFGSPTLPMTVEALLLSFLDDLDAKMNITEQLRRKMDGQDMSWTEYQRPLERYLYLSGFPNSDFDSTATQKDKGTIQPKLF